MPVADGHLIARALAGDDRHAFAELVRRHQSVVRGLLRKLTSGDAALADDLAQETFLRAHRGLAGYRGGARFSTWLCQIAYHAFVANVRRQRVRGQDPKSVGERASDIPLGPTPSATPRDGTGLSLLRVDLERALGALAPEERVVLALCYGQDLSHEEAASILDCPLGTLKSRVARAKELLRTHLSSWQGAALHDR